MKIGRTEHMSVNANCWVAVCSEHLCESIYTAALIARWQHPGQILLLKMWIHQPGEDMVLFWIC